LRWSLLNVAVKILPHPHTADGTRGIPGRYPRGYPGELKPVSATTWGNTRGYPKTGVFPTPTWGHTRGVPKKDVPTTGHIWGYSPGTICSVGVGKYFDCHISMSVHFS